MVESINATVPLGEAREKLAAAYDLRFTRAVAKVTERVHQRIRNSLPDDDWQRLAPLIVQVNRLKAEKNAAILADFHQHPAITWGVADRAGDDLSLIRESMRLRRGTFVMASVATLAESISLINPRRRVLVPDGRVRCPLANAMTRADVEAIRDQYPGAPVIAHINASLPVRAAAEATFTATCAAAVVEAMPGERVLMLPDQHLARHVARTTKKKIVTWAGSSDDFGLVTVEDVASLREAHPAAKILAHPQNPPSVTALADITAPTAGLAEWLAAEKPERAIVLGDVAVARNLAAAAPETSFIGLNGTGIPRRRIDLETILWSLHTMTEEIAPAPEFSDPARAAVRRMLEISGRR